MRKIFAYAPEAIENTHKIAMECNVEFEFGHTILPNYDVDPEYPTHYDFLKELCDNLEDEGYEHIYNLTEDDIKYYEFIGMSFNKDGSLYGYINFN